MMINRILSSEKGVRGHLTSDTGYASQPGVISTEGPADILEKQRQIIWANIDKAFGEVKVNLSQCIIQNVDKFLINKYVN